MESGRTDAEQKASGEQTSGYEISEREFETLFADDATARRLRRMLASWGLGIDLTDPVSVSAIHSEIQRNPDRRRAVYQVAMDLWR
jgi:hypothetical protein